MKLRSAGLDKTRVYQVRGAPLDRSSLHITLEDGTIAFTEDIYGRATGAFFQGEGEVLLAPPNRVERTSMALFTGMAILEERFGSAYFRFNDDTFSELQPWLRPADNPEDFLSHWQETAHNLAESDALRLLMSFDRLLPVSGSATMGAQQSQTGTAAATDRMLHARLQGTKLGNFDVYFDSMAEEQISVGQAKTLEGITYYDLWASFAADRAREPTGKSVTEAEQRQDEVTISRYKIRAEVKPPTELSADTRMQLEVQRGGQRALLFELSRFLQVKTVEADGQPVEFIHNPAVEGTQLARRGNDLVAVVFPAPLRAGQRIELRFVYGGEVLSEAGGGLLYVGARGTWYPNQGLGMSDFDLEFRFPPGWTLVATGKSTPVSPAAGPPTGGDAETEAAGEQVARWVSECPIPLAGFNLGRYVRAVARAGEVSVESYATAGVERTFPKQTPQVLEPPGPPQPSRLREVPLLVMPPPLSPARNAQPVADKAARAIDFLSRRFGPFPYSSLALTQMPGTLSQGWPGLVFLSSYAFLTAEERARVHLDPVQAILSGQVLVHETAHQWWGGLITWESYRDQWMVEGLANYFSLMMLESENPAEFRTVMEAYRQDLIQKNKAGEILKDAGPVTVGGRLSSSHFPSGYEAISYGRGTWLFHMLRHMLRDAEETGRARSGGQTGGGEPFARALRKACERFAGQTITTRDLLQVFEEDLPPSLWYEGRRSLDWFMQSWVQGTALPRLELQGVKFAPKAASTVVTGTILQKEAPNDLVTSVPVYAVIPGKSPVLLGRVFADGPDTSFRLTAPPGARKILLDPNQTILTKPR